MKQLPSPHKATPIDHMTHAHLKINGQPLIPIMWKQRRNEFNTSGHFTLTSVQPSYMINFCQDSHKRQLIAHLHRQAMGLSFGSQKFALSFVFACTELYAIPHCITLDPVILRPIWMIHNINSLAPGRCGSNSKSIIFKLMIENSNLGKCNYLTIVSKQFTEMNVPNLISI